MYTEIEIEWKNHQTRLHVEQDETIAEFKRRIYHLTKIEPINQLYTNLNLTGN